MFYLLKDVHLEQVELMLLFIVNKTSYSPLDAYGIVFFFIDYERHKTFTPYNVVLRSPPLCFN